VFSSWHPNRDCGEPAVSFFRHASIFSKHYQEPASLQACVTAAHLHNSASVMLLTNALVTHVRPTIPRVIVLSQSGRVA
jgi:hypothetical protein